jgi:hypothetical protein
MERAVLTISPIHSEDWRTKIVSFLQLQGNCLLDDEVYNKRMEARTILSNNRRGVIQARSLLSIAQVFVQNRRARINEGDTCRTMWGPHWV